MKRKDGVLKAFTLPFSGLKDGFHDFNLRIEKTFIEAIEWDEPDDISVDLDLVLEKRVNMLVLTFNLKGSIQKGCDRCSEPLEILVDSSHNLIVKFGEDAYEETDEIYVLPSGAYQIDVSHFVYEFLSLSVPMRIVHPDGECNPIVLDYLTEEEPPEPEEETDPRWAALKNLNKDK